MTGFTAKQTALKLEIGNQKIYQYQLYKLKHRGVNKNKQNCIKHLWETMASLNIYPFGVSEEKKGVNGIK